MRCGKAHSSTVLGYSAAGISRTRRRVTEFRAATGSRAPVSATHRSEMLRCRELCVRVPRASGGRSGCSTLGAIALRAGLAEPTLGEAGVVIGLGLLGTHRQLLNANGCRVFGIDLDPEKMELARQLGADGGAVADEK